MYDVDLSTSIAGGAEIIAFYLRTQTQKSDSGQLHATVNQDHTGSKLKCQSSASRMKDIFVIRRCDECASAAEPPAVGEEEASAALGSCSRMWEIIELCQEECNCF